MQKLMFFVVFTFISICGYSQQIVPANPLDKQTDLPGLIKGEIPADLDADALAEMLQMGLVSTSLGDVHPTITDNPRILAQAISTDSAIEAIFREYIITGDTQIRSTREDELLDLY